MNYGPTQQTNSISICILNVVAGLLPGVLGIQNVLVLLPVRTGNKRFNQ